MTAWNNRHGWKWIGAPSSGVLGLFGAQPSPYNDRQDHQLSNGPSHVSERKRKDAQSTTIPPDALPLVLRCVFLSVELVLSCGVGMLSVWCASLARVIVRSILGTLLAECIYTIVFGFGLVTFMTKLFQQNNRILLVQRLGLFWSPLSMVFMSLGLHTIVLVLVPYDLSRPSLTFRSVVLAPIEEEVFFRGLVISLALHRLRAQVLPSAIVTSVSFALVHLANARHATISSMDLLLQVLWAAAVGFYLALRYARQGSLLECVLLHMINNFFSAITAVETHGIGIVSIGLYAFAIGRELWLG